MTDEVWLTGALANSSRVTDGRHRDGSKRAGQARSAGRRLTYLGRAALAAGTPAPMGYGPRRDQWPMLAA